MGRPMYSVVIPTLGRKTLPRTLDSLAHGVEAVVVADTFRMPFQTLEWIRQVCVEHNARFLQLDAGRHDTGSPQLDLGHYSAAGRWVLNLGDDDLYVPDAFDIMAQAISEQAEPHPLMFRAEMHPAAHRENGAPVLLWNQREIARWCVTGQNFVCPNEPERFGRWINDWTFMAETVANYDGQVDWREELTVRCF